MGKMKALLEDQREAQRFEDEIGEYGVGAHYGFHNPSERTSNVPEHDTVEFPEHYTNHPSGVECIQITEHLNFCLGNVVKYLWRADEKDRRIEDLKKARWFLDREIQRLYKP